MKKKIGQWSKTEVLVPDLLIYGNAIQYAASIAGELVEVAYSVKYFIYLYGKS